MSKEKYSVFKRFVCDTNGNFEMYYGHSPHNLMQNVGYKKALKYISKNYKNIKNGEYLELYCETTKETIAFFGLYNHKGKKLTGENENTIGLYFQDEKGNWELRKFTAEQLRKLIQKAQLNEEE